jgi:uncharacterized membrane protein
MDYLVLAVLLNSLAIVYLIVIATLIVRRKTAGVLMSVAFAALVIAVAAWMIRSSAATDASVDLFTLPTQAALAGFFGLLFARWRSRPDPLRRIIAWGSLAVVVLYFIAALWEGFGHPERRSMRRASAAFSLRLKQANDTITAGLNRDPGGQRAYLDGMIRSRMDNRGFVLAALEYDSVSAGVLDTLANGTDSTIVHAVARHNNTSAETLTRIYRTRTPASYFAPVLASNRHTPKDILREMATTTSDPAVFRSFRNNPALDCGLLNLLKARLAAMPPDTSDYGPFASEDVQLNAIMPKIC